MGSCGLGMGRKVSERGSGRASVGRASLGWVWLPSDEEKYLKCCSDATPTSLPYISEGENSYVLSLS